MVLLKKIDLVIQGTITIILATVVALDMACLLEIKVTRVLVIEKELLQIRITNIQLGEKKLLRRMRCFQERLTIDWWKMPMQLAKRKIHTTSHFSMKKTKQRKRQQRLKVPWMRVNQLLKNQIWNLEMPVQFLLKLNLSHIPKETLQK